MNKITTWLMTIVLVLSSVLTIEARPRRHSGYRRGGSGRIDRRGGGGGRIYRRGYGRGPSVGFDIGIESPYYDYGSPYRWRSYRPRTVVVRDDSDLSALREAIQEYKEIIEESKEKLNEAREENQALKEEIKALKEAA